MTYRTSYLKIQCIPRIQWN